MATKRTALIIITARNVENYIEDCLDSVLAQYWDQKFIVAIDDASTDKTWDIIAEESHYHNNLVALKNDRRHYALWNINFIIRKLMRMRETPLGAVEIPEVYAKGMEDAVVFLVDGDDRLTDSKAILQMMKLHKQYDVVWSQHKWNTGETGCSGPLPIDFANLRQAHWKASHLRSFKRSLFMKIKSSDFCEGNKGFFKVAWDQAIMYPLIEMAGPEKCYFHDQILYMYRRWEGNDDATKEKLKEQKRVSVYIRAKTPYNQLNLV